MSERLKYMVGTGIIVALVAVMIATLANKRWWGRRITAKWDVHTGTEAGDPWTVYGPDWKKWSLQELFSAWQDGKKGWYPKGKSPELATTTEFDVQ